MRTIVAALVVVVVTGITYTWFWTIPKCLSSGWGTPGYWSTPGAVSDDQGVFGCWWGGLTRELVREQAFEEWAREGERLERERRAREGRW